MVERSKKQDDKELKKFYQNIMVNADQWYEVNGWNSKRSQYRRFTNVQSALDIRSGECLVDIGCGTGDLSVFFWEKGLDVCYHGFDLMQDMIDLAIQKNGSKFRLWDIEEKPLDVRSDWAVSIGTFSAMATLDEGERWANATKMIQNMAANVDKGFAFTMLNNRSPSDTEEESLWFVDAGEAVARILEIISPQMLLTVKMDYHPHEMMFVVKNDGF